MATGCQNMSTSNTSQISSINTYRITKQYYPATTTSPSPSPKPILKSANKNSHSPSPNTLDDNNNNNISSASATSEANQSRVGKPDNAMLDSAYADLNDQQTTEYAHAQGLKIKTKSIENTLLPLVNQITTLVNFKEKFVPSARTANALLRVGQAVNFAVERFVEVGESIAYENPTIKFDMLVACTEAKESGEVIRQHTTITLNSSSSKSGAADQESQVNMIQAANTLLNSVTKVLLLADVVIINQLLSSKNKALQTLNKLESVVDFWSFVNFFTQYGNDLVELAHLSGERQNVKHFLH